MRRGYIRAVNHRDAGGQRGGIAHAPGSLYDDYELEIGCNSHASPELLALCTLHDEIIELMSLLDSPLAQLVLREYRLQVVAFKKEEAETK